MVHGDWVHGGVLGGLEAQMVISVAFLRGGAGRDEVYLRCEAVGGAEPGGGDEGDVGVGVVCEEGGG